MQIAAIIAEYNPFHNGHFYQIRQARMQGATHIVIIMSGNFVQRGEPAWLEKHSRAKAAILCGADLILELPLPYALATAERFAFGGVMTAHLLGCIDSLFFGTEQATQGDLLRASQWLDSPILYQKMKDNPSDSGFPASRSSSMRQLDPHAANIISTPNNILGIEYIRRLKRLGSNIHPVAIPRIGAGYHSMEHHGGYASGAYLRSLKPDDPLLQKLIPPQSYQIFSEALQSGKAPVYAKDHSRLILSRLRSLSEQDLANLPDCSEGLHNRLYKAIRQADSYSNLLDRMKTKRYPTARLQRLVMSAFLGVDADLCRQAPPYIHLLALNDRGKEILSKAHKSSLVPLSHSLAELERTSPLAARFARLESLSTDLYHLMTPSIHPCGFDYTAPLFRDPAPWGAAPNPAEGSSPPDPSLSGRCPKPR